MKRISRNGSGSYLVSGIVIRAGLKAGIARLKEAVKAYPGLVPLGHGSTLRYMIGIEGVSDHFYTVEFAVNYIRLEIHAASDPLYFMKEAMLVLLSMCSLLASYYDYDIASLFPYLIELLASAQLEYYANRAASIKMPNTYVEGGMLLAKRISELRRENADLMSSEKELNRKLGGIIERIVIAEAMHSAASLDGLASKYNIGRHEIEAALQRLRSLGYKVVYSDSDKFMLAML